MSTDTFQLMQYVEKNSMETQLALQCAPVLSGIKISNLLNIASHQVRAVCKFLEDTPIEIYILYHTRAKTTLLLFRREALEAYLHQEKPQAFLLSSGYADLDIHKAIAEFAARYARYRRQGGEFPHEMGIFLGYNADDVTGFIENKGRNYLYSGYWKIYSNLKEAIQLFESMDKAVENALSLITRGENLLAMIS